MFTKVLTVSALNDYVKKVIDNDFILNNANIKGEISNFKIHSSGHIYFSLKDEKSKINCVMFRSNAEKLSFMPDNGMKIIAKGRVSVYEKEGAYQLYCSELKPDGMGELFIAFNKLKEKLEKEGLFDAQHKQEIPKYNKNIGVITSPTGAAVRDIINVTKRRNKGVNILIYPTQVQGINAAAEIIKGIEYFNKRDDIDLIIIARGGGSLEELWSFNDENLAYAVYNSEKPVITGVGHEIDYTIVDFVSDRRAPTPSAAAEIAVFNAQESINEISARKTNLYLFITSYLSDLRKSVQIYRKTVSHNSPIQYISNQYIYLDRVREKLDSMINSKISKEKEKLSKYNAVISAHNPLNVLNKGYSILFDENNEIIRSIYTLNKLQEIKIKLKDGESAFHISGGKLNGKKS